ncbi:MAG: type II secretion system F family protein [Alphaproteobacteria bacterium]|nr:type II secretion system F family protein [Alphaproteobacteria bacterium]
MQLDNLTLFYGAVFLAGLLAVEGIYIFFFRTRKTGNLEVNRRLRLQSKNPDGREVLDELRKETRGGAGIGGYLDGKIAQAGKNYSVSRLLVVMSMVGFMMFLFLVIVLPLPPLVGLSIGAVSGLGLPMLYLRMKSKERVNKFSAQLPDALDTMARSLRAGHPFTAAMNLASSDLPDPMGTELGIVTDEMTYGLPLSTALENLRTRVRLQDLDYMVVAITIQHETGGNLAEVLANLSRVIRDRFRMFQKIKALSAEGRLSAWVISVLPFFVAGIIHVINPSYFGAYLNDPVFHKLIAAGLFGIMLGAFTMFKMVNFRF